MHAPPRASDIRSTFACSGLRLGTRAPLTLSERRQRGEAGALQRDYRHHAVQARAQFCQRTSNHHVPREAPKQLDVLDDGALGQFLSLTLLDQVPEVGWHDELKHLDMAPVLTATLPKFHQVVTLGLEQLERVHDPHAIEAQNAPADLGQFA